MDRERQHYNVTLGILTLAGAAFSLQQTLVFPALSHVPGRVRHEHGLDDLGRSPASSSRGAGATPILGRLGDQYGKERLLLVSLGALPRRLPRRRLRLEHLRR